MDIKEVVFEGMDWNNLAQVKDRWWADVATLVKVQMA